MISIATTSELARAPSDCDDTTKKHEERQRGTGICQQQRVDGRCDVVPADAQPTPHQLKGVE